jgi:hypothetical protein
VRAHLEDDVLPWKHAAISGWILDPDRKKMSKSKGNVVTPMGLLESHGSDAVRYWAASARLGTDAAFDEGQMKVGRRLAMKVLNASKFVLGATGIATAADASLVEGVRAADHVRGGAVTESLDVAMLSALADVVTAASVALAAYDHTRALEVTETLFWTFCDDYVELVKTRAYDGAAPGEAIDPFAPCSPAAASARAALTLALDTFLRLFAPVLPFATEEVWSWYATGSVHHATWPDGRDLRAAEGVRAGSSGLASMSISPANPPSAPAPPGHLVSASTPVSPSAPAGGPGGPSGGAPVDLPSDQGSGGDQASAGALADPTRSGASPTLIAIAGQALAELRKIKSEAKVSQRTEILSVELVVPAAAVDAVESARADLMAAGRVRELTVVGADTGKMSTDRVVLAE